MTRLVAWGELLWDVFPDGRRLGGCAANVAYHAACLGDRAQLVSRVGSDARGREALDTLAAAGVDVSLVGVDDDAPTGAVTVSVEDGEPRFGVVEQAAWDRIEATPAVRAALGGADVLCYGTLAQRTPLASRALDQALEAATPACLRLCDLNLRPPFVTHAAVEQALAHADAVKLNRQEARRLEELFGVADAARWLLEERGIELVAETRGRAGCRLLCRGASAEHPGVAAQPGGDAVGAGDAFTAVLAHHLARRRDWTGPLLARAAEAANRWASFVASRRGAMPAIPAELRRQCG